MSKEVGGISEWPAEVTWEIKKVIGVETASAVTRLQFTSIVNLKAIGKAASVLRSEPKLLLIATPETANPIPVRT